MQAARESYAVRAEPYVGGGGRDSGEKQPKRLSVPVTFFVTSESLEEARDKVRQVIEHGKEFHNGDIEWEWSVGS